MRSRLIGFITIVGAVVFLTTAFVSATWVRFVGGAPGVVYGVALTVTLGYIPLRILAVRRVLPILGWAGALAAFGIGCLNYAVWASIGCWLVSGAAAFAGHPLQPGRVAEACFGAAALVIAYGVGNAAWIRTIRLDIALAGLPEAWRGRTVALVSDLHLGDMRRREFIARVVRRLNALEPKAVLIAGDMFDGVAMDFERAVEPWKDLRAPSGAFFASGNHDEFSDPEPEFAALRKAGVKVLRNEMTTVEGLQIVGVDDGTHTNRESLQRVFERAALDRSRASVLIAHRPSGLDAAEKAGISLQVSGHTHGGQFWPWTWVAARVHGPYVHGLHRHGALQVLTCSGTGLWGPPLRVGTRAEIVLVRLIES